MTEIVYLPLFKKDLQEIYKHIHDVLSNETAADNFIKAVEEAIIIVAFSRLRQNLTDQK